MSGRCGITFNIIIFLIIHRFLLTPKLKKPLAFWGNVENISSVQKNQLHLSADSTPTSLDLSLFLSVDNQAGPGTVLIVQGKSTPVESQVIPPVACEMPVWPLSITEWPNPNLKKLTQREAQAQAIENANIPDYILSKSVILKET